MWKRYIYEYLLAAGIFSLAVSLLQIYLMYDFESDKLPEARENYLLFGLMTFLFLYLLSVLPLAFMLVWNGLARVISRLYRRIRRGAGASSGGATSSDRRASLLPMVASYAFSVFLTGVAVSVLYFPTTNATTWSDPVLFSHFKFGVGVALAPAVLMGLQRLLVFVARALRRSPAIH